MRNKHLLCWSTDTGVICYSSYCSLTQEHTKCSLVCYLIGFWAETCEFDRTNTNLPVLGNLEGQTWLLPPSPPQLQKARPRGTLELTLFPFHRWGNEAQGGEAIFARSQSSWSRAFCFANLPLKLSSYVWPFTSSLGKEKRMYPGETLGMCLLLCAWGLNAQINAPDEVAWKKFPMESPWWSSG